MREEAVTVTIIILVLSVLQGMVVPLTGGKYGLNTDVAAVLVEAKEQRHMLPYSRKPFPGESDISGLLSDTQGDSGIFEVPYNVSITDSIVNVIQDSMDVTIGQQNTSAP